MDGTGVALLQDLADEQAVLDALVEGLSAEGWNQPTPAVGWSVADTVAHLLTAERATVASVRDGRDPLDGPALAAPPPSLSAPGELLEDWRQARAEALDALGTGPPTRRVPWGGRDMTVRSLATARLMECWAHGLDCFDALGVVPVDTGRLRHVAWLGWRSLPHAFALAGRRPPAPPAQLRLELRAPEGGTWVFGPEEASGWIRGPAGAWCRVATHRWRLREAPPLDSHGELGPAALAVARAFL